MKSRTSFSVIAAGLALLASAVYPAEVSTPVQEFDDADAKSTATGTENRVVLEAGDADAKATIRLANIFKSTPGGTRFGRYAFTVTAPFDSKKADSVDVGTLSGLTAGTSANFEYSAWWWPDANTDQLKSLSKLCEVAIPKLIVGYEWKTAAQVGEQSVCTPALFDVKALKGLASRINAKYKICSNHGLLGEVPQQCKLLGDALQSAGCKSDPDVGPRRADETSEQFARRIHDEKTRGALCALIASDQRRQCPTGEGLTDAQKADCGDLKNLPEAKVADDAAEQIALYKAEAITAARSSRSAMQGVTFGVKANHQNFSFVLPAAPTTAEKSSETGVGVSIGYTYVGIKNLFTAGYSHEESYKASGKVQVCSPIGTTGSLACKEASLGAPRKEKAELGYLEAKRIIKAGRFAVAPRVEYDFKDSNYAVRVPLYFIANKEHQLTAGVALGYTDADDEGFGAAVFVSKAFAFFE